MNGLLAAIAEISPGEVEDALKGDYGLVVSDTSVDLFDFFALEDGCVCAFCVVCVVLGLLWACVRRFGFAVT